MGRWLVKLPYYQGLGQTLSLLQTKWISILNPFLSNPLNEVTVLTDVALSDGETVINHGLGQVLQGWFIVDITAPATIYRSAPFNSTNLTLTSDAAVTVDLGVF